VPASPLKGIRACVFDAYGTLFDYASATRGCRNLLGNKLEPLTTLWREKQLQYTWLRSVQHQHRDFWQVTSDALQFSMRSLGLSDPSLHDKLMELYLTLSPFPEVAHTLQRIKAGGLKTAILSNGTPRMLQAAVQNAGIQHLLDAILSVEEVGVFKPDRKVYQLAVDRLGYEAHAIAFQSSNAWDAWAASAFGMQVVWCNRYQQQPELLPGKPDCQVRSLAELLPLVGPASPDAQDL